MDEDQGDEMLKTIENGENDPEFIPIESVDTEVIATRSGTRILRNDVDVLDETFLSIEKSLKRSYRSLWAD